MSESKGFKDVVANIKEGEIWENENFILMLTYDKKIRITHKEGFDNCIAIYIDVNSKFKLKREEYTFAEAFKAYEEGKEIESVESKFKYIDGYSISKCGEYEEISPYENVFSINEIRGKWYINDY